MRRMIVLTGLVALGACGNPGASGGSTAGAGWKGEEACKTLDRKTVAAAVGIDVTEEKLDGVRTLADSPSALSTCYYTLKSGGTVALLTRQSPDADNTPEAMKQTRDEVAGMMGPVEDVKGVGRNAFWIPKARQLNVFAGDDRYFNITVPAELNGKDPKTIALALATRLS